MKIRTILALLLLVIGLGAAAYWYINSDEQPVVVDVEEVSYDEINGEDEVTEDEEEPTVEEDPEVIEDPVPSEETPDVTDPAEGEGEGDIPGQFNLAVPFTSQAPHSNWELPYQEACEEASVYMVAEYFNGTPSGKIDPNKADADLLELIAFEDDFLGFHLDTTAAETVSFMDAFYGLSGRVVENPTVQDIKKEIAAGRPVIIPAAGRRLGNPNFSGAGPLYHMFVIKGYTATQFITNDPGTRNGENFVYNIDVVMNAIGDWNNGDPENGAKRVIFVNP